MPAGRPRKWNENIEIELLKKISTTHKSLKTICKGMGISVETVLKELRDDAEFSVRYARAKEDQADLLAEEIIEIADDDSNDTYIDPETGKEKENREWTNRSRLRVDARKWIAAKLKPKKYSDRVELAGSLEIKQITGMEIK